MSNFTDADDINRGLLVRVSRNRSVERLDRIEQRGTAARNDAFLSAARIACTASSRRSLRFFSGAADPDHRDAADEFR